MLDLYVEFVDGSSYCVRSERDSAASRRELDRFAWLKMSKPNVVAVEVRKEAAGRRPGYRKG